ncbi:MAG: hypothetical protein H7X80_09475, partial [bacterium]|nr:hypothetical protein [Candidatus Kapabacteria bacterium]
RLCQEQVFVNEIVPREKVRFNGSIVIGGDAIKSVRLVKAEPIPIAEYPEFLESAGGDSH